MTETILILTAINVIVTVGGVVGCAGILHAAVKLYSETKKQEMIRQLKKEQPEKEPEPPVSCNSLEQRMRYCDAVGRHEDARAYALVIKNLKGG